MALFCAAFRGDSVSFSLEISVFIPCPVFYVCNFDSLSLEISVQLLFFQFLFSSFLIFFFFCSYVVNVVIVCFD